MNKYNQFHNSVFKSSDKLINIITGKNLPLKSSKKELEKNFFLKNQKLQSLENFLFKDPTSISLTIIPTWECNLRCQHCFVLHKLVKKQKSKFNYDLVLKFLNEYLKRYQKVKNIHLLFIGGEVSLKAKENNKFIKELKSKFVKTHNITSCCSTNLTLDNYDAISFYKQVDNMQVSIDGPEEAHNEQRKSVDEKIENPFKQTLKVLKKLIKLGMRDKITIQMALSGEKNYTKENILELYEVLLRVGVKKEKIKFGMNSPNIIKTERSEVYLKNLTGRMRTRPCCSYRFMQYMCVDSSNKIYSSYHDDENYSYLGKLTDSIEIIEENYKTFIKNNMPVLNDPNCLSCPVIGACWGYCTSEKTNTPSKFCGQQRLINEVTKSAEDGNLSDYIQSASILETKNIH